MTLKLSLNWFVVRIPVAVAVEHGGTLPATAVFFSAGLAVIPGARLIVTSSALEAVIWQFYVAIVM